MPMIQCDDTLSTVSTKYIQFDTTHTFHYTKKAARSDP